MASFRATYLSGSDNSTPKCGAVGFAAVASGHDDPESAEYGAYLFTPDGDVNAYYVAADDLDFSA